MQRSGSLTAQLLRLPQVVRFVIAGGTVTVVNIAGGLLLHEAGLPLQVAIPTAFLIAMVVHFNLQRYFVFAHHGEFALKAGNQLGRYLFVTFVQYVAVAALTAALPGPLGVGEREVYVVLVILAAAVTFVVLRLGVFHAHPGA